MSRIFSLLALFATTSLVVLAAGPATPPQTDSARFFTDKIRPIFEKHCLACHGQDKKKGKLDLATRDTVLEGGRHGAAVVPGNAEESLLWKKVAAGKMPPAEKLSKEQVADLKRWIATGAVYDGKPLVAKGKVVTAPWSFAAVARPEVPASKFESLARNDIDRFLLAALEKKGLTPSPAADRLTLLRRVTVDLTGMPPTLPEIDAFLADQDERAYEKVVDRLLASSAYGERWARHWLDVIRFGESHGYEQNHIRPNAWPYRDYVIRAFNDDKPFDRFLTEQIAGDVVGKGDPAIEAATGFLVAGVHDTVGNGTDEGTRQQRANDLEDMVSTVGAAFLGLTVGCAKCHDHKFDPISQHDFYRFSAVFAGVRHGERPLGVKQLPPEEKKLAEERNLQVRRLWTEIEQIDLAARARVLAEQGVKPVPRPAVNPRRNVEDFPAMEARFVRFRIMATKDGAEPCLDELQIFGPGDDKNFALAGKATASSLLPGYPIHQIGHLNDGKWGNDFSWIGKERGSGWVQIELPKPARLVRVVWSRDGNMAPKFQDRLPTSFVVELSLDGEKWHEVASGADRAKATEAITGDVLRKAMSANERERRAHLEKELAIIQRPDNAGLSTAYVGQFGAPDPIYLLQRGDVMKRGELVEPAGLSQIPRLKDAFEPDLLKAESGRRLALAKWLTDADNPLTARVIVNRVWQYHFGRGLVATPSDFGNNGSAPSHPELLDWLAHDIRAGGWKLQRLHKMIVTSHAYRQGNSANKKNEAIDADNVYLWRMPLRRMEAEALRDSILAVSGKLDRTMGGPGFLLFKYRVVNVAIYETLEDQGPPTWRRGVYALSARAIRDELMAGFDGPECAQRTPRREVTTTPLQALTLLNGAFTAEQAKFFAQRVEKEAGAKSADQVRHAFRLAFGRSPTPLERDAALDLLERHNLAVLCRALLNANEFLYY